MIPCKENKNVLESSDIHLKPLNVSLKSTETLLLYVETTCFQVFCSQFCSHTPDPKKAELLDNPGFKE